MPATVKYTIFLIQALLVILPPRAVNAQTPFINDAGRWIFQSRTAGWLCLASAVLIILLAAGMAAFFVQSRRARKLKAEVKRHRQVAYEALKRQQALADTLNHLNDFVYYHDLAGNFYEFNIAVERIADYSETELRQMNIKDLVPDPYKSEVDDYLERIRKTGKERGYMRIVNKKGRQVILEYNTSVIYEDGTRAAGIRGIARDITEQHYTSQALKKSEKKYRTILNTIEDGYYEVDLNGHYQLLNRSALVLLGYDWEELKDRHYKKLIAPEDVHTVFETFNYVFRTHKPVKTFNWRAIRKDGSLCHLETSVSLRLDEQGKPIGFQGIIRDISDRIKARQKTRQLEVQLQQAQKMESIGTLAGGIAHDFNNILFPIIGYTELTMQELSPETTEFQNLEKVIQAAERAKALVHQILAFSRRQHADQDSETVLVQPVIKETLKLLGNTLPASIEIRSEISTQTGTVTIHPARLHQLIMNLCTNAYHAMEDMEKGVMNVSLRRFFNNPKDTGFQPNLKKGNYLCITVSDTGCGISPEIMQKIFDPYFTTKSQEKGTGLGLSVAYGIVQNAGGIIVADSNPENGSSFHVYLPENTSKPMARDAARQAGGMPGGNERILIIDNETRILEIEQITLKSLGYRVDAFVSSTKALKHFKADPQGFDLVITDQSMPQISGLELIGQIRRISSDIPVILCTGYSEKITPEIIKKLKISSILLKPIARQDIAETVRKTLDSSVQMPIKDKIS